VNGELTPTGEEAIIDDFNRLYHFLVKSEGIADVFSLGRICQMLSLTQKVNLKRVVAADSTVQQPRRQSSLYSPL
jgi:hypothetical protein